MSLNEFEAVKVHDSEQHKQTSFDRKSYKLRKVDSYMRPSYYFEKPQEITCFSADRKKGVWFDDRELRYYHPPTTASDLNDGYQQADSVEENNLIYLDTVLDALTNLKINTKKEHFANIVTWRGVIAKILRTPYMKKDVWEFQATRYNGTIFMEDLMTEQKKNQEEAASDKQKRAAYWGHKFESMCTRKMPPGYQEQQDELAAEDTTTKLYCAVVKTKIGKNSIIMATEIDCCKDRKPCDPIEKCSNYIELTTSKKIKTENQKHNFERYKLLKLWTQSVLVGVPKIVCGFRDNNGQLIDIQEIQTQEIPSLLSDTSNMWKPSVCFSFANEVLNWIVSNISQDDATITYSIKFDYPYQEITIECTRYSSVFLTQRYIDGTTSDETGGPRVQIPPDNANDDD